MILSVDPLLPTTGDNAYAAMRARAAGTNVNEKTLLATDYLNHFNEIIMLIELLPDAPECVDDCRAWRAHSYVEHFARASIADSDLAIEAYALSPETYRAPFDAVVADMNRLITTAIGHLTAGIDSGNEQQTRHIAETATRALREMVDRASAIIHGETPALQQSEIDSLLRSW